MEMDKKQQKQIVIIGVLGVVLLLAAMSTLGGKKKKGAAAVPSTPSFNISDMHLIDLDEEKSKPPEQELAVSTEWIRDPFGFDELARMEAEQMIEEEEQIEIILNGIIWDESAPLAMVNGELYPKGADISGFEIIEITEESVVLDNGIKRMTLSIWEKE